MKFKLILFFLCFVMLSMCMSFDQNPKESSDDSLGSFSVSLAVKDIQKSFDFYTKLGFKPLEGAGGIDQKWIMMTDGNSKIGLFQDMFPQNSLTFNPVDGRRIYNDLIKKEIAITYKDGVDKKEGPCSFAFVDPDGNPILIDQH